MFAMQKNIKIRHFAKVTAQFFDSQCILWQYKNREKYL